MRWPHDRRHPALLRAADATCDLLPILFDIANRQVRSIIDKLAASLSASDPRWDIVRLGLPETTGPCTRKQS
ncbi:MULTISPECIES: hypothetical protein [Sphingopyxis]|jgi:hypothetical protein|uniref:hypothetical protein n=1 Tax=Sphingopyxis TaxID=165697 RepID=UPI0012E336BA|nr:MULTISPECIES: hypothetical protein [Sphingopyxis]